MVVGLPHKRQQQRRGLGRVLLVGLVVTTAIPFLCFGTLTTGKHQFFHSNPRPSLMYYNAPASNAAKEANNTTTATSACLYIMDDNHYLIEWLAYHYHVVNLRHLILTSDPNSLTSPQHILDRWKNYMSIELWNDEQFITNQAAFQKEVQKKTFGDRDVRVWTHRVRQATFSLACLKHHKEHDRGWVMMVDTDEYLTFHPNLVSNEIMAKPGSLFQMMNTLQIPNPVFEEVQTPCVPVHRIQFSAQESSDEEVDAMVPAGFDGHNFQTMRWRRYDSIPVKYITKGGDKCTSRKWIPNKVIVDLKRVRMKHIENEENTGNPHQPLAFCNDNLYLKLDETPFVVNHYMGTMEQWLYRAGDRRGQAYRVARYFDVNMQPKLTTTDGIRPWLRGFVESVGRWEAKRLLQGVGILEPLPVTASNQTVAMQFDFNVSSNTTYKVGDKVQANFNADGDWYWAEVYAVLPNEFYNIFYLPDCSAEKAVPAERLRLTGQVSEE